MKYGCCLFGQIWIWPFWMAKAHYGGQLGLKNKKVLTFFLSFHAKLWERHKRDLWHNIFNTILFIFQMWIIFQQVFIFSNIYANMIEKIYSNIFLWNNLNETLHMKLKWCNQFKFNICIDILWVYIYNRLISIKKHNWFLKSCSLTFKLF